MSRLKSRKSLLEGNAGHPRLPDIGFVIKLPMSFDRLVREECAMQGDEPLNPKYENEVGNKTSDREHENCIDRLPSIFNTAAPIHSAFATHN